MNILTKENLFNLIKNGQAPTASIYMPVFSAGERQKENPIRLKNLVDQVEAQLSDMAASPDSLDAFLSPMKNLVDNELFWQNQQAGLALFLDSAALRIYKCPQSFDPLAVVGDQFHVKPLIPLFSGNGQFLLLSLDLKKPELYLGSKFRLNRIEDVDLPESLKQMFDEFYEFHTHLQFHTKTGNPNPDLAGDRQGEYFGQGGDDIDENAEILNYFHQLDQALMDFLDGKEIPIVLAGVDYLHPLYREANSASNLLEDGIIKDVDQLDDEKLHAKAWGIVESQYENDVQQALGVYHSLAEEGKDVETELQQIVSAAHFQRINTLFLAEDAHVWGKFDAEENHVIIEEEKNAENQDLLNLAAADTLINGGNVVMIPQEAMPEEGYAAAILRY